MIQGTRWDREVPPPSSFGKDRQSAYQRQIDQITGTTDGRSRIRLEWGPRALTWQPHRLEHDPVGYAFPQFYTGTKDGVYLAAERWVLLQRIEWEQYAPTWEAIRYTKHDGSVWDLKGPCPSEKYVALKCHAYHDGKCCKHIGECDCPECWGVYVEPNEDLLNWVRKVNRASQEDKDVDPFADIRFFESPQAQRDLKSAAEKKIEASKQPTAFDEEAVDLFIRQPRSINLKRSEIQKQLPSGFKKNKQSGLYTLN